MSESTRRAFVRNSAAAAAGVTVLGALVGEQAEAATDAHHGPVVAYVSDAKAGTISVMAGDRTVEIHDRQLAGRITRAARS
jgi:hypothetical protein